MADQYTLRFPDGKQYGPVDRSTLEAWKRQGRIPDGALAWPDGAPDWLPVEEVLSPARPTPEEAAAAPREEAHKGPDPDTQPHTPAGLSFSPHLRAALLLAGGVVLVLALLAGLVSLLRPTLARRRAIADIERYALADRRLGNARLGFVIDLPPGWVALEQDNPFVVTRGASLRVSHPALEAFGAARDRALPELMGDLDAQIDLVLQERLATRPSEREVGRSDVQLGRGQGRLVRTAWEDGLDPVQGATAVWRDGYEHYWLDTWAPASTGEAFVTAVEELVAGIAPSGSVSARVEEAAERLAPEVPELPRDALRLLIGERMSRGEDLDTVPVDAMRAVSRGLEALNPQEAEDMGLIYGHIWAPVPERQRRRLAQVLALIKADSPVPASEVRALRAVFMQGVAALPPDARARLQELSGRAVEKSLVLQ